MHILTDCTFVIVTQNQNARWTSRFVALTFAVNDDVRKPEMIKVWSVILLTVGSGSVLTAFTPTVFSIYFRWEAPLWSSRDGCQQLAPYTTAAPKGGPSPTLCCSLHPHYTTAASGRNLHKSTSHQRPPPCCTATTPPSRGAWFSVNVARVFLFFHFPFYFSQQSFTQLRRTHTLTILDVWLEFDSTEAQKTKVNHWP